MIPGLRKWEYIGTVAIFDGRAIDVYESPTSNIRLTDGESEVMISENQLSWFVENMVTNIWGWRERKPTTIFYIILTFI